jgi:hypothetical protein
VLQRQQLAHQLGMALRAAARLDMPTTTDFEVLELRTCVEPVQVILQVLLALTLLGLHLSSAQACLRHQQTSQQQNPTNMLQACISYADAPVSNNPSVCNEQEHDLTLSDTSSTTDCRQLRTCIKPV